jgi:hypothetical protein
LKVLRDEELIEKARQVASSILAEGSNLSNYPMLKDEVEKLKNEESSRFIDKS